jgi:FtsZ-binding cell division protein ZapB
MAAFESIHVAACSSLAAQLDTGRELVGKFKDQQFATQESFALYQDALEISKNEAKRQEERIDFLEMENLSLIERVEEELAASYEDSFVHEFLGGKVKDDHHPPLLVQAKINEMPRKNTSLATNIERLSKQNDALEKDLETAHRESETLRDSETALV